MNVYEKYVKEWLTSLIVKDMKMKAIIRSLKKFFACLIDKKMMTFAQYPQESGDWPSPLLVRQ